LIVFYVDIGHLPRAKADAWLEKFKKECAPVFKNLPERYKVLYLPSRTVEMHVEFIPFEGTNGNDNGY
jgi:hypothetical protein